MNDQAAVTHTALSSSVPLFDPTLLPLRRWCTGSREDPLTGLIAFPDFHSHLPRDLAATLTQGGLVGLAIGDVDGLKGHVEQANATDPDCYGHLAGNKVMAQLGATSRDWFHDQDWRAGCVATFGGDEVIVAAAIDDPAAFVAAIERLRDRLAAALPIGVSFALAIACAGHLPERRDGHGWKHVFTDRLLATVDRCLFAHKAIRRGGGAGGTVCVTDAPVMGGNPATGRTLLPLPTDGQRLHVLARPTMLAGRRALVLPCAGPAGLRGQRVRVGYPRIGARSELVVCVRGQAVIPASRYDAGTVGVPLTLGAIRQPAAPGLPDDLAQALALAGAGWHELPNPERVQVLRLVTESANAEIRAARVLAAVDAVSARTSS